jgi:hypothetical protein
MPNNNNKIDMDFLDEELQLRIVKLLGSSKNPLVSKAFKKHQSYSTWAVLALLFFSFFSFSKIIYAKYSKTQSNCCSSTCKQLDWNFGPI